MSSALVHRGPDESGSYLGPGVGLAARRLSIVGLGDGRQPVFNEDRSVVVVFNGELFDYPERRAELAALGHRFATSTDTEVLVHLWEEHGEAMVQRLRGQFAFALLDTRRRVLLLARDRVGIAPLYWAVREDWLCFGSEIKALLASGLVCAAPDVKGIDHVFTFMGTPAARTVFRDIHAVLPGTYWRCELPRGSTPARLSEHTYWDVGFPEHDDQYDRRSQAHLEDAFGEILTEAVRIRLRGDVPVAGYLSGGVDSTTVMALATRELGHAVPSFTVRIPTRRLDETDRALVAARHIGTHPTIIACDRESIRSEYPGLIVAAEVPVIDTSCAALYRLAREVHRQGFKVVLTGEGADEALAGYPWFKFGKAFGIIDCGRVQTGNAVRQLLAVLNRRSDDWQAMRRIQDQVGGANGLLDFYSILMLARRWFYSQDMLQALHGFTAFDDLRIDSSAAKRWHPLNRALYLGYKAHLPGLLLSSKGDRPAMHHSVEIRPPYLDHLLIEFCACLPPALKLRGLFRDKHLLRAFSSHLLPRSIANRPKAIFRAPLADTFLADSPPFVEELLSNDSLRATGYFSIDAVHRFRRAHKHIRNPITRLGVDLGLTGVVATQLWHHTFMGGGLCSLPSWQPTFPTATSAVVH